MNNKSNFFGNETPPNYLPQLNFTSKGVKICTKTNKIKQKQTNKRLQQGIQKISVTVFGINQRTFKKLLYIF